MVMTASELWGSTLYRVYFSSPLNISPDGIRVIHIHGFTYLENLDFLAPWLGGLGAVLPQ